MAKSHIYELCYMHSEDHGRVVTHDTFGCLEDARNALKREIGYDGHWHKLLKKGWVQL